MSDFRSTPVGWPDWDGGAVEVSAAGLPSTVGVIGAGELDTLPPWTVEPPGVPVVELLGDFFADSAGAV